MSYNLDLEQRLDRWPLSKKLIKRKMFGGIGYLHHGNMAFGIHKQYLVVRTSPEQADELLQQDFFSVFNITGRAMKGWVMVAPEDITDDSQLLVLLNLTVDYVKTMPRK